MDLHLAMYSIPGVEHQETILYIPSVSYGHFQSIPPIDSITKIYATTEYQLDNKSDSMIQNLPREILGQIFVQLCKRVTPNTIFLDYQKEQEKEGKHVNMEYPPVFDENVVFTSNSDDLVYFALTCKSIMAGAMTIKVPEPAWIHIRSFDCNQMREQCRIEGIRRCPRREDTDFRWCVCRMCESRSMLMCRKCYCKFHKKGFHSKIENWGHIRTSGYLPSYCPGSMAFDETIREDPTFKVGLSRALRRRDDTMQWFGGSRKNSRQEMQRWLINILDRIHHDNNDGMRAKIRLKPKDTGGTEGRVTFYALSEEIDEGEEDQDKDDKVKANGEVDDDKKEDNDDNNAIEDSKEVYGDENIKAADQQTEVDGGERPEGDEQGDGEEGEMQADVSRSRPQL